MDILIDINECETGSNLCNGSADCADTDGSYECMCMTGYSGDGFICESELFGNLDPLVFFSYNTYVK